MSLAAWPLNESEAGGDLTLIETSLLFYVNDAVLILISRNLHNKRSEVSNITRSPPASLSFKGQVTRHTTAKRSILSCRTAGSYMDCMADGRSPLQVPLGMFPWYSDLVSKTKQLPCLVGKNFIIHPGFSWVPQGCRPMGNQMISA